MSDPNYAHEFVPNRKGLCKTIISESCCHEPETAPVHQNWIKQQNVANKEAMNVLPLVKLVEQAREWGRIYAREANEPLTKLPSADVVAFELANKWEAALAEARKQMYEKQLNYVTGAFYQWVLKSVIGEAGK